MATEKPFITLLRPLAAGPLGWRRNSFFVFCRGRPDAHFGTLHDTLGRRERAFREVGRGAARFGPAVLRRAKATPGGRPRAF